MELSTQLITKGVVHMLRYTERLVVANYFYGRFEADVLSINKSGYAAEYEVKVSRADLVKDKDKSFQPYWSWSAEKGRHREKYTCADGSVLDADSISKYDMLVKQPGKMIVPNRFSYVVTEELSIEAQTLIPEWAGLYVAHPNSTYAIPDIRCIRVPKKLHKKKMPKRVYFDILKSCYYRYLDHI